MTSSQPAVTVVTLAWGEEPDLHAAVRSALDSRGVDVSVVVVDNGCTSDAVATLPPVPRMTVLTPPENLGFAGGVNYGAADVATDFVALLNSDAEFVDDALARLVEVAARPGVGIASGSIRLAHDPQTMNSAGNPLHVVGLSWAGGFGEPASRHAVEKDVASASGAGVALRTALWRELGGFDDEYFAYHEDVDLSWRTWASGRRVVYVPDAVVLHHYEFSRNALKMYLLEKNRRIFVRSSFSPRLRAVTWLPTAALDVAMSLVATRQGWGPELRRARRWVADHGDYVRSRRRRIRSTQVTSDREMGALLTAELDQQVFPLPPGAGVLQAAMRGYWSLARRLL
ncbi:glycosyl transferase [Frigoribacterium sp. Leaf164]|uniref:glycosyltransferase n=1 Tax=Frigoribacterium sp. Leaf164 TaxID=1736282 RepID=UPI000701232A|nr:glycosyltransferase family 2 protein [Frigoribacterium sp. Leaf164]KQR46521.1 glycosyl transferase [Frigoribacterium sp. Leaf164]